MDKDKTAAAIAARKTVRLDQKAWKFLRDVNSSSVSYLNRIAIEDGFKQYTYGLMFREWERYASVFSALGMTGASKARVGLLGSTCAEVIFSLYGLNMVGAEVSLVPAYSALFPSKIKETIHSEKLTDFIITDDFAQAKIVSELLDQGDRLGIKNIILLHVPVAGITVDPMLKTVQENKYSYLKNLYGPVCMEELLALYGNHPVHYASEESSDAAFILHTSGTTSGTGKPVALSDKAFNAAAACFYGMEEFDLPYDHLMTAVIVDLSNAYGVIDQVHLPFAMGAGVVFVPGGILNPGFYKAIPEYGINFLFTISAMFERWMKAPEALCPDFSSLSFVVLGGTSVSASDKSRYFAFMKAHGAADITLLNGYGISELGGACCLSGPDIDDESIGYPLPGVHIRLYDDDQGCFLPEGQAPCEGVLYLTSPSVATLRLDGKEIMKYESFDGNPYICTNDLVRLEEDGRLTFLGRANRYFINEEGRKYESGRVETEFARQPGIESCCIVPVYVKTSHDNIPMLCVKVLREGETAESVIVKALRKIFIEEQTLMPDLLPYRVMIAEDLPRNRNGKIDLYKISRGEVEGRIFTVKTISAFGRIGDLMLLPYQEGPADMIKEVLDGITEEMKGSMPFSNYKSETNQKEDLDMKSERKTFDSFNNMNRMGMKMMKKMMGRMGDMSKAQNPAGSPFGNMPYMGQMMSNMQRFVQQASMNQIEFVQNMAAAQMEFMQGMADMVKGNEVEEDPLEDGSAEGQQEGFKLGDMTIPPELLGKLMSLDMSPENLEKLQGILDFVFDLVPETETAEEDE